MTTLRELEPDSLWAVEMPCKMLGVSMGARSTLVRLPDGGLWVHSPIALSPELRLEVDALGPLRCIVAPTKVHTAYTASWAASYPEAKVFVSPQWKKALPSPPQVLGEADEAMWSGVLRQVPLRGSALIDEVEFFHSRSKTLIVCDLLFNLPSEQSGLGKLKRKMIGMPESAAPSRLFRATIGDRKALRASLERVLAWDFERIILSHGSLIESGGRQALRTAFEWLWQN